MPKQVVNISDTIKQFQEKFNSLSTDLGWRGNLTTTVDSDVIGAINELDSDIGARPHTTLTTTSKNLTGAVNELNSDVDALLARTDLGTAFTAGFSASTIMTALNEVKIQADLLDSEDAGGKLGELSLLDTPRDSDIVAAINSVYALVDSSLDFTSHFSAGAGVTLTAGEISISSDAITYDLIQNVSATDRILGRDTAGAGNVEELTPAAVRTMLNIADGSNNYSHPNHTGDVTSAGDGATTISADAVTYAKMQNLGTANRVLGGTSAGGAIAEVQVSQDMIADDAVGSVQIADDAVGSAQIADDAVGSAQLESVVSLIIYNSAGTAVKTLYGAGS
jgi:hypothetical protein